MKIKNRTQPDGAVWKPRYVQHPALRPRGHLQGGEDDYPARPHSRPSSGRGRLGGAGSAGGRRGGRGGRHGWVGVPYGDGGGLRASETQNAVLHIGKWNLYLYTTEEEI